MFRVSLLSLAASMMLSGCTTDDISDLKQFVDKEKTKPASYVKPLPQPIDYTSFEYDAADLRDPFVPVEQPEEVRVVQKSGIGPNLNRNKEELEKFPLDSLRMVGTLNQKGVIWALIRGSDGTVHRVRTDNYMGQNYGKIINITDVRIDLIEFVRDGLEGWVDRKATVSLSQ